MAKTEYIPDHLKNAVFLAKKAGSFSDVPLRTLQSWTEKRLVIPGIEDTTGTGSKRLYNYLNCIEIAIIKEFTREGMRLNIIKDLMDFLRRPSANIEVDGRLVPHPDIKFTVLESLLVNKPGFLVYEIGEDGIQSLEPITADQLHEAARKRFGEEFDTVEENLRNTAIRITSYELLILPILGFKKVILNISQIADRVLEKIK